MKLSAKDFAPILPASAIITDPDQLGSYQQEQRGRFQGQTPLVLRPETVDQISVILSICHQAHQKIVPQGGNTGLVAGTVTDPDAILLSLSRLNKCRDLDVINNSITVEAGMILADVQEKARQVDRLFPLSYGAEGSCQIGGSLSTNAGGIQVLRYGNARDLCLGLEVVLATGEIWHGLRGLRKNNVGYDLKHLFIGGEGSLGIITAATLKLFPRPQYRHTLLIGCDSLREAYDCLTYLQQQTGDQISAFEVMPKLGFEFAVRHIEGCQSPFGHPQQDQHPNWGLLVEWHCWQDVEIFEKFAEGLSEYAVFVAQTEQQQQALWQLRRGLVVSQSHEGGSIKHDVSVPISAMADFIAEASEAVQAIVPNCRPLPFGHLGDGNVHFNVSQPVGMAKADFLAYWEQMTRAVFDIVCRHQGSFSAEHGIGRIKSHILQEKADPVEYAMMQNIKKLYDPHHILNPGCLLR